MGLGKKLKQMLDEKNITVKDFAIKIDVAPTTLYSFIKRDSTNGKLELIAKICIGLDISLSEFLNSSPKKEDTNSEEYQSDFKNLTNSLKTIDQFSESDAENFARLLLSLDTDGLKIFNKILREEFGILPLEE